MKSRLLAPLGLFALTIGVHWKTLLTDQYVEFDKPDLAYQAAPWLQAQAVQWHQRRPMLWDPYQMGGQSLIGQIQPGVANPINWALFLSPLKNGFLRDGAFNWYIAMIRFLAALAAYALCRDLGRSVSASMLGACAYGFAGYIATSAWPNLLACAAIAPFAFLFTARALRGERAIKNAIISGAFLGLGWLGGHHQIPTFTALAIGGVWMWHIARKNRMERTLCFAALLIAMVAVSAVQSFPSFSYGKTAVRWVNISHPVTWDETVPYSVHEQYSLQPASVLGVFLQSLFTWSNPFVGIAIFTLALLAIALAWNEPAVRLFAAIGTAGLIFSFAGSTILHGIIYALVPFADKARNPAMAIFIFNIAAAVLAAFGADALVENAHSPPNSAWLKRAMLWCAAVALAIWIFEFSVTAFHTPVTARIAPIAVTGLVAVLLIALLYALRAGSIQPGSVRPLLIVLVMLEIGSLTQADLSNREQGLKYWSSLSRDGDLAAFLKSRPGPYRVDFKEDDVPYNFGDWYGVESYSGYVASAPEAFMRIKDFPRAYDLFGVRYFVGREAPRPGLKEVFTSAAGIKVFESSTAMPRAWSAHQTYAIGNLNEMGPHLNHPSVDFNRLVLLMGERPRLEDCSGDRVNLTRHDARRVGLDVDMACRGMVIVADGYSPDWIALVDGNRAPVYAAYGAIRGVVVERGHHTIEMRYRPMSVYAGGVLTALSLLAVFLLWRQ